MTLLWLIDYLNMILLPLVYADYFKEMTKDEYNEASRS